MKAFVYEKYGPPRNLHLEEVPTPVPADDQVLIKIHTTALNRSDWEGLVGSPAYVRMGGLLKPGNHILGSDIAGTVEAAGKDHTEFKPGDQVYGDILYEGSGGFGEYIAVTGKMMALKPAGLTFEQAAAIPQSGVIALQAVRDIGNLQQGQHILINGAGGGTGTFTIQLAKRAGAEVTAVDHGAKLDFLRQVGADHVIDYTHEDFSRAQKQYDMILDVIASRSVFAAQRALKPDGSYFVVGGAVGVMLQTVLFGRLIRRKRNRNVRVLLVRPKRADMSHMAELCETGTIMPIIDPRRFMLREVPDAMRHLGEGHARGKVVVNMALQHA